MVQKSLSALSCPWVSNRFKYLIAESTDSADDSSSEFTAWEEMSVNPLPRLVSSRAGAAE